MRHSSSRTLQRSEWACALLLSSIALQRGHPTVAPNSSMSCWAILSVWIRAPSNGNCGIEIGSTRIAGLSTVHLPSVILQSASIAFLTASLSHVHCGSNLLISRALNTSCAFSMTHYALLFRMQCRSPNLHLGFILFMGSVENCFINTFSPTGQFIVTVRRVPVTTFLTSGQDASCNVFQPRQNW